MQLMFALLLLAISFVLTVNIRPYETRALNYLEECSLLVLMLTQAVSLIYLDADAKALATGSRDETNEAWATFVLLALNALAIIVLGGAFAIAVVRYYGPKVRICLPGDCCASAAARVLDETWEEIVIFTPNIELVWVDVADGVAIVDAPDGIVVKWQDAESGAIVAPIFRGGLALPPPMGFDLAMCDAATGDLADADANRTPAWRNTVTGAFVELDDVRSCTMWLNHRTGALSRVNPHADVVENEVAPLRIADAGAAGAAGAAAAAGAAVVGHDADAGGADAGGADGSGAHSGGADAGGTRSGGADRWLASMERRAMLNPYPFGIAMQTMQREESSVARSREGGDDDEQSFDFLPPEAFCRDTGEEGDESEGAPAKGPVNEL